MRKQTVLTLFVLSAVALLVVMWLASFSNSPTTTHATVPQGRQEPWFGGLLPNHEAVHGNVRGDARDVPTGALVPAGGDTDRVIAAVNNMMSSVNTRLDKLQAQVDAIAQGQLQSQGHSQPQRRGVEQQQQQQQQQRNEQQPEQQHQQQHQQQQQQQQGEVLYPPPNAVNVEDGLQQQPQQQHEEEGRGPLAAQGGSRSQLPGATNSSSHSSARAGTSVASTTPIHVASAGSNKQPHRHGENDSEAASTSSSSSSGGSGGSGGLHERVTSTRTSAHAAADGSDSDDLHSPLLRTGSRQ